MNKFIVATAPLLAVAGLANAADNQARPYVGIDYTHAWYSMNTDKSYGVSAKDMFKDSADGAMPYIGIKVNKYFSAEVNYLQTGKSEKKNVLGAGVDTKYRLSGYGVEAIGSLPVDKAEKFALLGTAGIGHYKADIEGTAPSWHVKGNVDDTGYTLGAGAQYQITDNIGVRALGRYLKVDLNDTVDNAVLGSVGVNYKF